ncbi:sce7726 family protein [Gluconobacter sp. LMG 31484]|uniref:Sce7726 family protein n=1 Tax=Gluconobacter vitians TaxID=2728102 RepID=A0ABR9Y1M5_9PROT|nr:sce7726 family protein [Gluconobacter vitians]MBF0857636.1 sce7726 family protein [Gluconobacter vitians]
MNEAKVKAALLADIRRKANRSRDPLVTTEFTLGDSGVRADLIHFSRNSTAYEIKTERDSLRRLHAQIAAYSQFFPNVVAVIAPNHLPKITPEMLGRAALWTYDIKGRFSVICNGKPEKINPDVQYSLVNESSKKFPTFLDYARNRYSHTSENFWDFTRGRSIKSSDLKLLSRFQAEREIAAQIVQEREDYWKKWLETQLYSHSSQSSSVSSARAGSS